MSGTVSAKSLIGEPKKKRAISPLAGKLAPKEMLVDVVRLEREYFERWPDAADPNQLVNFGPSGYRGSPLDGTFPKRICNAWCWQRDDGIWQSKLS